MALYLYCVRERSSVPFSSKGLEGRERVFTITCKDLDLVVSTIPKNAFRGQGIARYALEDIAWIAEKAKKHEAVVEEAMGSGKCRPVIPLKFGTIFRTREDLLNSVALHYDRFLRTLKKLDGKQEWHCKVFLQDAKVLERTIRLKSKVIKAKEKEMKLMNEGAAYFVDMQITARLQQEKDKMVDQLGEYIFRTLKRHAEAAAYGKTLAKELTGISEPMILNGIFLLKDAKIGEFQRITEHVIKKFPMLRFACSGPWPPYNFV